MLIAHGHACRQARERSTSALTAPSAKMQLAPSPVLSAPRAAAPHRRPTLHSAAWRATLRGRTTHRSGGAHSAGPRPLACASRPTDDDSTPLPLSLWRKAEPVVEGAASLLPERLPLLLRKVFVLLGGGLLFWWGLTSLLNTVAALVLIVGLVLVAFTISGTSGGGGGSKSSSSDEDEDSSDPLVQARKIMDKYK